MNEKSRTTCWSLNKNWYTVKMILQRQLIHSLHACTHTQQHSRTQHWILAQMAPNGLVIKGVMSCLWWRLCVPLPVIHFLSSCPFWRKTERKRERTKESQKEKKCMSGCLSFVPFPTHSQLHICHLNIRMIRENSKIRFAIGYWLFKHLSSKSADLSLCFDASNLNIIAYRCGFYLILCAINFRVIYFE